jgi:hypothetical protein
MLRGSLQPDPWGDVRFVPAVAIRLWRPVHIALQGVCATLSANPALPGFVLTRDFRHACGAATLRAIVGPNSIGTFRFSTSFHTTGETSVKTGMSPFPRAILREIQRPTGAGQQQPSDSSQLAGGPAALLR